MVDGLSGGHSDGQHLTGGSELGPAQGRHRLEQVGTRLEQIFFSEHRGCSNCSNLFQPLSSSGEKSEKNLNKKDVNFPPQKATGVSEGWNMEQLEQAAPDM